MRIRYDTRRRVDWDTYFMNIAKLVSTRATCPRASVGAVLVKDKYVLSTGYNGAVAGEPHCTDVGCDVVDGHCQRAIHAEMNAVAQAAKRGVGVEGAVMYVYDDVRSGRVQGSCRECRKLLAAVGVEVKGE